MEPSSNQTTPALEEIAGTLVEPSWNLTSNHPGPPCSPYLKPPRPPRSLEPWWNPGGTLVKPSSNPQPSKKLVEPWWNPRGTLPQTPDHPALAEPGGTLVEPWWNPGGTLVEPWWNPGGTLVEPWWNPGETWWNLGGTLVEPLVEPWWNLSSGSPRTTPEPIWAETPKLSAVGGKKQLAQASSPCEPPPPPPPPRPGKVDCSLTGQLLLRRLESDDAGWVHGPVAFGS